MNRMVLVLSLICFVVTMQAASEQRPSGFVIAFGLALAACINWKDKSASEPRVDAAEGSGDGE